MPSLKAVAESPAFLDPNAKPANSKVFLDGIPSIRAVPVMDTWVDIEETVGAEMERAYYGQASVEEAISTAKRRTMEYFPGQRRADLASKWLRVARAERLPCVQS
ncbi:MAG: hypothetical protein WKH64_15540 [Chloroflexia bacterium]